VKVGIRYGNPADLDSMSSLLDNLCDGHRDVVIDKGRFETTTGECKDPPLPDEIVVDYIACHSIEFFMKYREELETKFRQPGETARFLLQHKQEVTAHVAAAKDIFRDEQAARPLRIWEICMIRERFIHHLLNASKVTRDDEQQVWRILLTEYWAS